jgi:hypothetical protein
MKNKHAHITAFYLETLLMILVFVAVILMLTQVFGASRKLSAEAGYLSDAATISESVSAAVRASDDEEALIGILNGAAGDSANGTPAVLLNGASVPTIEVRYDDDLVPAGDGPYEVTVTWEKTAGTRGDYVDSEITVRRDGVEEPVLVTHTGTYTGKPPAQRSGDRGEVQP